MWEMLLRMELTLLGHGPSSRSVSTAEAQHAFPIHEVCRITKRRHF